jgi:hypothetical protein
VKEGSAPGHLPTSAGASGMSALPSEADIGAVSLDVSYGQEQKSIAEKTSYMNGVVRHARHEARADQILV